MSKKTNIDKIIDEFYEKFELWNINHNKEFEELLEQAIEKAVKEERERLTKLGYHIDKKMSLK